MTEQTGPNQTVEVPPIPAQTNQASVPNTQPPTDQSVPIDQAQAVQNPPMAPVIPVSPPSSGPIPVIPPSNGQKIPFTIVAGIGLVLLIVVGGIGAFISMTKSTISTKEKTSVPVAVTKTNKNAQTEKLASDIQKDTDFDSIPDFVEIATALDPAISELTRCAVTSCGKSDKASAQTQNTLIILDASGSMATMIGSESKMAMAKEAIKSFVTTVGGNGTIGLMVYGHKGSNATSSKAVSCSSAELIGPLGSTTSTTIDGYLAQFKPTGWTPIGLAIENAISAFSGKVGQKNQIIIVSDGVETCGTDPAGKAAKALASASKIQVNVIGFAVATNEQTALSDIAKAGGGTFKTANSTSELEAQFEAGHKNFQNFQADATCVVEASSTSYKCLDAVRQKAQEYIDPFITSNFSNGPIFTLYSDMLRNIRKTYGDKIDEVQNATAVQTNERKKTLLGQ